MTPRAAKSLAAWLAREHPPIFRVLTQAALSHSRSGLGRLGDDGTGFDWSAITVDPPTIDPIVPDLSPPLQDISTLDVSQSTLPDVNFDATTASTTGGGFLSSIGGALGSAVSAVGGFLTSNQGMTSLANVATAYFKAQTATTQAQTQQQILQTQLQRAQAGLTAAPISYTRNPYTGALQPVYQTASGYVPLTSPVLSQLTPFLSQYGIWIAAGVLILILLGSVPRGNSS